MLSDNSPFLRLPTNLNPKQAVFLDGMRHAAQIANLSYTRLCHALTELAVKQTDNSYCLDFTHVFLDAWAFIDVVDRFRCLWEMQPNSKTISDNRYSPVTIRSQLQAIRDVRNVSAHIAQKIDQIVSMNSSVLGSINWVTVLSQEPLKVKTFFIRPGIAIGTVKGQLAIPSGEVTYIKGSGYISLAAGKYEANLSEAYKTVHSIIKFAEYNLIATMQEAKSIHHLPKDVFGSAELNTNNS